MVAPTSGGGAGEEEDGGASMRPQGHHGGGGGGGGRRGSGRVRGSWTPEEDDLLRGAVARHGPRNWSVISAEVPGRSGKSCRLRWCNQLSPGVERRPFTPDEDALIVAAHAQYGNKWATIARMLHGRTDNSVKNHWNSTLRRHRRAAAAAAAAAAGSAPPALLRHLLTTDPLANKEPAPVASVGVPFQSPLDLKRLDDGDGDEEEEEDDEDEDGSSEDSVLMPPRKKRLCLGSPLGAAKKPTEHATKPLHQPAPTPPAPPEPVTSLTLSLPGGGGGGGGGEAPALTQSAAASMDGIARMRAKLEQDWPLLLPVMRQMICEEVRRQLQGANVLGPLVASSAGSTDGRRESANGPD